MATVTSQGKMNTGTLAIKLYQDAEDLKRKPTRQERIPSATIVDPISTDRDPIEITDLANKKSSPWQRHSVGLQEKT